VRDSGAGDWAELAERLHYVADLFRAYQEGPQRFHAPFTREQMQEIKAGRKPVGQL
jgi:hypothetical protein